MKNQIRKLWKWFAAIAIVVGVALWVWPWNDPAATTLNLATHPWSSGRLDERRFIHRRTVWVEMRSERIIKPISKNYSIEAHTPAGETTYDARFEIGGIFEHPGAGALLLPTGCSPLEVAVPLDADAFRVSIDLEEFGASHNAFWLWVFHRTDSNRFAQIVRFWLLQTEENGIPRTIYSPWMVKTNGMWVERP